MFKPRIVLITLAIASLVSVMAAAQSLPFLTTGNLVVAVEGCGVEGGTCSNNPGGNATGANYPAIGRVTNPSTQQQTSQNVQPAAAAPSTIPPPPPKEILLGQTEDVVVANHGYPEKITMVGGRDIYFYRDLRVNFVNGKVTDVAAIQVNTSPGNTAPPARAPETLDRRISDFKARQEKLLQGSETIVFSGDNVAANAIKVYPFLQGRLNGTETVRLAASSGNGAGMNILFLYKQGEPVRDNLSVYVDHGTGYKEAFRGTYTDNGIHVSRADGELELFIERALTSYHTAGHDEFVLQNNVFLYRLPPHPQDCCGPAFAHH